MYQQPSALPKELTGVAKNAKYFWGCDESNLLFVCLSTGIQSNRRYYKNLTKSLTKMWKYSAFQTSTENETPSLGDMGLVEDHGGGRQSSKAGTKMAWAMQKVRLDQIILQESVTPKGRYIPYASRLVWLCERGSRQDVLLLAQRKGECLAGGDWKLCLPNYWPQSLITLLWISLSAAGAVRCGGGRQIGFNKEAILLRNSLLLAFSVGVGKMMLSLQ